MTTFKPEGGKAQLSSAGHSTHAQLMESGPINRSDLISSVRQLVGSVTANLKISPTATNGIEEAMARLEATDENFNRSDMTDVVLICIGMVCIVTDLSTSGHCFSERNPFPQ